MVLMMMCLCSYLAQEAHDCYRGIYQNTKAYATTRHAPLSLLPDRILLIYTRFLNFFRCSSPFLHDHEQLTSRSLIIVLSTPETLS